MGTALVVDTNHFVIHFLKLRKKNIECTYLLIYEGNLIIIRSIYVRVTYNNILVAV